MIVYTSAGLLYTAADYDSLKESISMPPCDLQAWFCPTGGVNPEWIENQTRINRLLDEHVWDAFISDWDPRWQGPLVLPKHCDEVLRHELGDRFIGPIDNVPGPRVDRRASLETWFTYVMHNLTKFGDENPAEDVEPDEAVEPYTAQGVNLYGAGPIAPDD